MILVDHYNYGQDNLLSSWPFGRLFGKRLGRLAGKRRAIGIFARSIGRATLSFLPEAFFEVGWNPISEAFLLDLIFFNRKFVHYSYTSWLMPTTGASTVGCLPEPSIWEGAIQKLIPSHNI